MAQRKSFLLRLPPDLLDDLGLWARDDLRSLNAQIEYLLREAVRMRRRRNAPGPPPTPEPAPPTPAGGPASEAVDASE